MAFLEAESRKVRKEVKNDPSSGWKKWVTSDGMLSGGRSRSSPKHDRAQGALQKKLAESQAGRLADGAGNKAKQRPKRK